MKAVWDEGQGYMIDDKIPTRSQWERDFVDVNDLRQEAIRWVKEISDADYRGVWSGKSIITKETLSTNERIVLGIWIKHFFNIK